MIVTTLCKVDVTMKVMGRRPMHAVLSALDAADLSGFLTSASVDFERAELNLSIALSNEFCSTPADGKEKLKAILSKVEPVAVTRMRAWVWA